MADNSAFGSSSSRSQKSSDPHGFPHIPAIARPTRGDTHDPLFTRGLFAGAVDYTPPFVARFDAFGPSLDITNDGKCAQSVFFRRMM